MPPGEPFVITNMLKYKDKSTYMKYANWAERAMKQFGIKREPSDVHDIKFTLIGSPQHEFDEMFSVRYSIRALRRRKRWEKLRPFLRAENSWNVEDEASKTAIDRQEL